MTPASNPDLFSHGWLWLLVLLGPLLFFQRRLQLELQAVLYLVTGSQEISLAVFSLLLFPGVSLHEASHWLTARLLGVRTGKFSLIPRVIPGGKLRMGFVELAAADIFREALIGSAPLFAGLALVAYIGIAHLEITGLSQAFSTTGWDGLAAALARLPGAPDFWIWFYLVFAVSSTMFPSPSDRRAWLPVAAVIIVVAGLALLAGAGPLLVGAFGAGFDRACAALASLLGLCAGVQGILLLPLWLLRLVITRLGGYRISF